MKRIILSFFIITFCHALSKAEIICTFMHVQIDSNQFYQFDADGDGTKDFIFNAYFTPYVNNYVVALNGNEIEVEAGSGPNTTRAKRLEPFNDVGTWSWNDTAYMISDGSGSFAGGIKDYGFIGLRLNKGGNSYLCFVELRTTYWAPSIALYSSGYNNEAGSPLETDACPYVSVPEEHLFDANVFIAENYLHVSSVVPRGELNLLTITGQTVHSQKLQSAESIIALDNLSSGVYIVAVRNDVQVIFRRKVFIP